LSHAAACADILLLRRKQYAQGSARLPTFSKLYDVFMSLEKEIEDALPQFQELLLTLK
jgi:rabenosyn-5